jgi:hypothetical protein
MLENVPASTLGAMYRKHIEMILAKDIDGLLAQYADDAVLISSFEKSPKVFRGHAELREHFNGILGIDGLKDEVGFWGEVEDGPDGLSLLMITEGIELSASHACASRTAGSCAMGASSCTSQAWSNTWTVRSVDLPRSSFLRPAVLAVSWFRRSHEPGVAGSARLEITTRFVGRRHLVPGCRVKDEPRALVVRSRRSLPKRRMNRPNKSVANAAWRTTSSVCFAPQDVWMGASIRTGTNGFDRAMRRKNGHHG